MLSQAGNPITLPLLSPIDKYDFANVCEFPYRDYKHEHLFQAKSSHTWQNQFAGSLFSSLPTITFVPCKYNDSRKPIRVAIAYIVPVSERTRRTLDENDENTPSGFPDLCS